MSRQLLSHMQATKKIWWQLYISYWHNCLNSKKCVSGVVSKMSSKKWFLIAYIWCEQRHAFDCGYISCPVGTSGIKKALHVLTLVVNKTNWTKNA